MQIRKCREADVERTGAFYDNIVKWLDEHINYPKWVYKEYPSLGYAKEMTAAGEQYICEDGGRIVGAFVLNDDPQGNYQLGRWENALPDGSYLVIHAVAVDPDRQGHGLGSEIIRYCTETAKTGGYKALRVDIVPDNYPARKLHEDNGFTYAGDADLERGIEDIPVFSLYELNF